MFKCMVAEVWLENSGWKTVVYSAMRDVNGVVSCEMKIEGLGDSTCENIP